MIVVFGDRPFFRSVCFLAVISILAYFGLYLFYGTDGSWRVHDGLDSSFVLYKLLAESDLIFADNSAVLQAPMGGQYRISFPSEFDYLLWLFRAFGPETAYLLNRLILIVTAFAGALYLLRELLDELDQRDSVAIIGATAFALLPFWPYAGLSVAGLPLLFLAHVWLRENRNVRAAYGLAILYAVGSSIAMSGVFALAVLALVAAFDLYKRRLAVRTLLLILLVSAVFILRDYRLFLGTLFDPLFVSHRVEMFPRWDAGFFGTFRDAFRCFVEGQTHALSLQTYVILPTALVSLPFLYRQRQSWTAHLFLAVMLYLLATSLWAGAQNWYRVRWLLEPLFELVPMNIFRFYVLHPLAWIVLWGLSLAAILRAVPFARPFVLLLFAGQIAYSFANHEVMNADDPSAKAFYSKEQFARVADFIGRPKEDYRVASVGIHPSIALYNGFQTIDGYMPNYPLEYKRRFRAVIAGELQRSSEIEDYFDSWGSRAYVFSSEIPDKYLTATDQREPIERLGIDAEAFAELGGQYLISAVPIRVIPQGFRICAAFPGQGEQWTLYLYQVEQAKIHCLDKA